jgi:glutathione S-transferase
MRWERQWKGDGRMLKVYGDMFSGNCFKVKLLLNQRELAHEWIHVDILMDETRTQSFLAKNPNGRIPLLEFENGTCLAESNAILHYLADDTSYLPDDRLERAQVLQWLFFEQYSHEPYIATSRYIIRYLGRPPEQEARLQEKRAPGYAALDVMERHLGSRSYFVGERYTIADIGLYAYTHVAHEGGFDLAAYPAVLAWIGRVQSQPKYLGMNGEGLQPESSHA